jgi:ribonucleoside-diphosphate reductase subunit M1
MYVTKRDGKQQPVSFDKITERIAELTSGSAINCGPLSDKIQPIIIAQKVCAGVFPGVTTMELDDLAAETACYMSTDCPEYSNLAARIAISNLHKQTDESFFSVMTSMRNYINPKTNKEAPLICEPAFEFMTENAAALDAAMKYERDFTYDFFAYKTLERSYLSKLAGVIVERPQHMIMRVACGIHGKGASGPGNLELVLETYELMSQKWFTHASPTLFNACSPMPQLSSCFLLSMVDDSIEGIYETLKRCALISKTAGGIGLALHVRHRNRPQPASPRQMLACLLRSARARQLLRSGLGVHVSVSTAVFRRTSARVAHTSLAPTAPRTVSCRCCASTTRPRASSTRCVQIFSSHLAARAREPSR